MLIIICVYTLYILLGLNKGKLKPRSCGMQQGIALIWIILGGAFLITSVEMALLYKTKKRLEKIEKIQVKASPTPLPLPEQVSKDLVQQEPLLKILLSKERAKLESAIRQAQEVLKNIDVFNFTPPIAYDIKEDLNIEKQPEFQPIDPKKIEEYFNQNPPAVPQDGKEFSPAEKEYYYRKNILKDPAFQY